MNTHQQVAVRRKSLGAVAHWFRNRYIAITSLAAALLVVQVAPAFAAPSPNPAPTLDYSGGTVPPAFKNLGSNILATVLYVGGIAAIVWAIVIVVKMLGGAAKMGGKLVLALVLAIACIAPASFMASISDIWNSLNS